MSLHKKLWVYTEGGVGGMSEAMKLQFIYHMQIQFKLVVYICKILFDYTAKQIQTTQHKTKTNNTKIHIKQNSILKEQNSVNKKATT